MPRHSDYLQMEYWPLLLVGNTLLSRFLRIRCISCNWIVVLYRVHEFYFSVIQRKRIARGRDFSSVLLRLTRKTEVRAKRQQPVSVDRRTIAFGYQRPVTHHPSSGMPFTIQCENMAASVCCPLPESPRWRD